MTFVSHRSKLFLIPLFLLLVAGVLTPNSVFADGVLENIPNQTVEQFATLSFTATTTPSDGSYQYYLEEGAPQNASINIETGLFSWAPNETQSGTYSITVILEENVDGFLPVDSKTFDVVVTVPDSEAPTTEITSPNSGDSIIDDSITITGTVTDNVAVASTTIISSLYLTGEGDQADYCDYQFTDIITLDNPSQTWSYSWTPPADGVYCLTAFSRDISGNIESGNTRDGPLPEISNITFTKKIDPVPTPEPPAPEQPSSFSGSSRRNLGGSGGGGSVLGASTEQVALLMPEPPLPVPGTVDIVWKTNVEATSQVIYGLTTDGPYRLNLDKPNFGYTLSTLTDTAKVKNHSVTLPSIVVGKSYSVRVVSKLSQPTFGPEYRFTLNADGTIASEGMFGNEIIVGQDATTIPTLQDFVKTNEEKIKSLFGQ